MSDGHDTRGLVDQLVPGITAMIDDLIIGFEDAVGEPVVPHNCQIFSTGLSSGHLAGSVMMLIFSGMMSASVICHPA